MRVCQPVVDNIRKVFEVGEKLLDAARDPLLTLLEWRLMFGRDGFAVQKVFKELFFGLFCWWWPRDFRQQRNRRYNDQKNEKKFKRHGYCHPRLLANLPGNVFYSSKPARCCATRASWVKAVLLCTEKSAVAQTQNLET